MSSDFCAACVRRRSCVGESTSQRDLQPNFPVLRVAWLLLITTLTSLLLHGATCCRRIISHRLTLLVSSVALESIDVQHRRSQDFLWGALFSEKVDDPFLVVTVWTHAKTAKLTTPSLQM